MSREVDPLPDEDEREPPEPTGNLRPTSPGTLVSFALVGFVLGWALKPVSIAWRGTAPTVGWTPVLALFLVAAIVGGTAWSTHRTLHRRHERLAPHQAVNRLVLAKSCALVGALVGGGYLGYALSWIGVTDSDLAKQRLTQSLLAALAAALVVTGSLLLERACRVSGEE